jgi:hypothetical protein
MFLVIPAERSNTVTRLDAQAPEGIGKSPNAFAYFTEGSAARSIAHPGDDLAFSMNADTMFEDGSYGELKIGHGGWYGKHAKDLRRVGSAILSDQCYESQNNIEDRNAPAGSL